MSQNEYRIIFDLYSQVFKFKHLYILPNLSIKTLRNDHSRIDTSAQEKYVKFDHRAAKPHRKADSGSSYKRFKSAVKRGDTGDIIDELYRWIDRLELKEPTLHFFAKTYGNEKLMVFVDDFSEDFNIKELRQQLVNIVKARKKYLKGQDVDNTSIKPLWINP